MDEDKTDPFTNSQTDSPKETEPKRMFHSPSTGVHVDERRGGSKLKPIILILIVLLLLGVGGYFAKQQFFAEKSEPLEVTETTSLDNNLEVTPIETPIPTPTVDRSEYTVRILNGTKTSGLAASASAKLKELGFQVEKTGNATNSAFLKTVVRVKEGESNLLSILLKDLMPDFTAEEGPVLKQSDTSDAEVILGTE